MSCRAHHVLATALLYLSLANHASSFCVERYHTHRRANLPCRRETVALNLGFDLFNTNGKTNRGSSNDAELDNDDSFLQGFAPQITSIEGVDAYLDWLGGDPDDDRLTVIKFYGSWCKSCAKFGIRYKKLALEEGDKVKDGKLIAPGRVRFAEVEFGANARLCRSFGIRRLPYIHMHKGKAGKVADFVCGPAKFQQLIDKVNEYADMSAEEVMLKEDLEKGASLGDEITREFREEPSTSTAASARADAVNATQVFRI